MLLTSQNRETVYQAQTANVREGVLAAAVAHRMLPSKRRFSGMRRTRRTLGLAMREDTAHRSGRSDGQPPVQCAVKRELHPRLWASLVLSKIVRG